MSGILIGQWCASAGHNDDSGFGLRLEDLPHIDIGFLESAKFTDDVLLAVVIDNIINLYSVEFAEDGRRVANDEKFILGGLINSSNGSRRNKLTVVGEANGGDGGG